MSVRAHVGLQETHGLAVVPFGARDSGQVQGGYLIVGGSQCGDLSGQPGAVGVPGVQVVGGRGVQADVNDRADHVLVEAVAFGEPSPPATT